MRKMSAEEQAKLYEVAMKSCAVALAAVLVKNKGRDFNSTETLSGALSDMYLAGVRAGIAAADILVANGNIYKSGEFNEHN